MTAFQRKPDTGENVLKNNPFRAAIIQRHWDERWDDLEAAGWERCSVTEGVWHPRWGCHNIVLACSLQDKWDLKRGRTLMVGIALVCSLVWVLLSL